MKKSKALSDYFESASTNLAPEIKKYLVLTAQSLEKAHHEPLPFLQDQTFLEQLQSVWIASEWAASFCYKYPDKLIALYFAQKRIDTKGEPFNVNALQLSFLTKELLDKKNNKQSSTLLELVPSFEHYECVAQDESLFIRELRHYRNLQLFKMVWGDVTLRLNTQQILEQLSHCAEVCVQSAIAFGQCFLKHKYGLPQDAEGRHPNIVTLAMGKLGGNELNFSSDIDLIFLYPSAGMTAGGARSISNEEYYTELSRFIIRWLDTITEDGFVFRMDLRLRPYGDSGPLVMSFSAFEIYLQAQARDWERYAMIKARAISGSEVDCQTLEKIIRPFVYRRYLDFSTIESLRKMHGQIETQSRHNNVVDNIKLGKGGIREIEFIGQMYQLIYGGKNPSLQSHSITATIQVLNELKLIDTSEADALKEAYIFLRRLENRLQMYNDQQTHSLPSNALIQIRIALTLGYACWEDLLSTLQKHCDLVHQVFRTSVFSGKQTQSTKAIKVADLPLQWCKDGLQAEGEQWLSAQNFTEPDEVMATLIQFFQAKPFQMASKNTKNKIELVVPQLLMLCKRLPASTQTLQRCLKIVESISKRSAYLTLLIENQLAIESLSKLCSKSSWLAEQIAQYPWLLDECLDPRQLFDEIKREQLSKQLRQLLDHADSLEEKMDQLRAFKSSQVFRVAAASTMSGRTTTEVSDNLSDIAESIIEQALDVAWEDMVAKHGFPDQLRNNEKGLAIVAYGKLGGRELGYTSDLDLVFIYEAKKVGNITNGDKPVSTDYFYQRLVQRFLHVFHALTVAGVLYQVDTRLRPSGNSGLLITSIDTFEKYQHNEAWTWEHQALVRARGISGDSSTLKQFFQIRKDILSLKREPNQLKQDISQMRLKMLASLDQSNTEQFDIKHGTGGVTDIEFLSQYAMLLHAADYPHLMNEMSTITILRTIANQNCLLSHHSEMLISSYTKYRELIQEFALSHQLPLIEVGIVQQVRKHIIEVWEEVVGPAQEN